jgi:hypothetical protein
LLQRIIEHFAAAAFALQANRSFDAVKIIIPSVIASIADVVMRKKATDIPSEVKPPKYFFYKKRRGGGGFCSYP